MPKSSNSPGKESIEKTPLPPKQDGRSLELIPSEEGKASRYYIIENQTLQLVVDANSASLAEINLPLHSKSHPQSPVKQIELDIRLEKQSPINAHFPLLPKNATAFKCDSLGQTQKANSQLGGYYPLLRRGDGLSSGATYRQRSPFYGCHLTSTTHQNEDLSFELLELTPTKISLKAQRGDLRLVKTFELSQQAPNCFDLSIDCNQGNSGIWISSGILEAEMLSGAPSPQIKYQIDKGSKPTVVKVNLPSQSSNISSLQPHWLCNSNGFFGLILRPLEVEGNGFRVDRVSGSQFPSRLSLLDRDWNRFPVESLPGYQVLLPLSSRPGISKFQIFAGPLSQNVLNRVDTALSNQTGQTNPDFSSCQSFHGWFAFISQPFAKILMILMAGFFKFTHSWALSICLLTVALRVMLYPLNSWSMVSTKRMRELAPLIHSVQQKYKKEPQRAQKEVLKLYRENNINPLSGCLPLLLQMPFLIGMFDLLKSSFELRGAGFIPGWIDDLSSPDVLFTWSVPLPFFGHELHILPLLVGLAMYWQQLINSPQAAAGEEVSEQQKQQKTVGNIMTIVFAAMFYHFPSGLNIYWLSSILLGIAQQAWFQRAAATPVLVSPKNEN